MLLFMTFLVVVVFPGTSFATSDPEPLTAFEYATQQDDDYSNQMMLIYKTYCRQSCSEGTDGYLSFCHKCFCDDTCVTYGDCCPDKTVSSSSRIFVSECEATTFSDVPMYELENHKIFGVFKMITVCPILNKGTAVDIMCSNTSLLHWSQIQPVTDLSTRITYRNKYCAQCNRAVNVMPWSIDVACFGELPKRIGHTPEEAYISFNNITNCFIQFNTNFKGDHPCVKMEKSPIASCNQSGIWKEYDARVQKACNQFPRNLVKEYANIFCYMCNTDSTWGELLEEKPPRVSWNVPVPIMGTIDDSLSNQNVQKRVTEQSLLNSEKYCPASDIWDPYKCVCRDVQCADGKMLLNGICHEIISSFDGYFFSVCLDLYIKITMPPRFTGRVTLARTYLILVTEMIEEDAMKPFYTKANVLYLSQCGDLVSTKLQIKFDRIFKNPMHVGDQVDSILERLGNISTIHLPGENITVSLRKTCDKSDLSEQGDERFCKEINPTLFSRKWRFRKSGYNRLLVSPLYNCLNVHLDPPEATVIEDNNNLRILATGKILDNLEFLTDDTGYLVCDYDYIVPCDSYGITHCTESVAVSLSVRTVPIPNWVLWAMSLTLWML